MDHKEWQAPWEESKNMYFGLTWFRMYIVQSQVIFILFCLKSKKWGPGGKVSLANRIGLDLVSHPVGSVFLPQAKIYFRYLKFSVKI